jgi:hypothetical protein
MSRGAELAGVGFDLALVQPAAYRIEINVH